MRASAERPQKNMSENEKDSVSLGQLASLFLKLGFTAFGGPAGHIALMDDEVVRRRRWLTREEFLDLLGATNLIPGPNSTELAIHIGHRKAGWKGLLMAGVCFILPAVIIATAFAWVYLRYGSLPQAGSILYGVKPVIIAVILQALWRLGKSAIKTGSLLMLCILGIVLYALRVNELAIIFGGGIITAYANLLLKRDQRDCLLSIIPASFLTQTLGTTAASFGLWPLFLIFIKVGSLLFGSGYVLLAFLRADLVERSHWLTEGQLLDAIAVGQIIPGPVFTTATFIGFVLGGYPGAIVATVGIFLPAFFFVAVSGPLVPRIRRSVTAGAFLDGVNAASLSLMTAVTWQLGRASLIDWVTVAISAISLLLLMRFRVNSVWLVLGGTIIGLLIEACASS
jgi:chromate transporter